MNAPDTVITVRDLRNAFGTQVVEWALTCSATRRLHVHGPNARTVVFFAVEVEKLLVRRGMLYQDDVRAARA